MIVGLVGPFGSGCSMIAKDFFENEFGYQYLSLSDILREEYRLKNQIDAGQVIPRNELQTFGNDLRREHGAKYLSERACVEIKKRLKEHPQDNFVIDSIRNPEEVYCLKSNYADFYVFGIFAKSDIRWERVKDTYKGNQNQFLIDEKRDKGEKISYGQRVTDSFLTADAIILNEATIRKNNEEYRLLKETLRNHTELLSGNLKRAPTEEETIMSMAYSNSLRSSCLKRKVGAIVIDEVGNVFSSGYNEVPNNEKTCKNEYGECYRTYSKKEIEAEFGQTNEPLKDAVMKKVKLLEKCRALHAEENAILNVARFGSAAALRGATLYTTTYPCNLCANKIAQVGIRKVVYFEPYPVEEAKITLEKAHVEQEMFEGITFNAYFKAFSEIIL